MYIILTAYEVSDVTILPAYKGVAFYAVSITSRSPSMSLVLRAGRFYVVSITGFNTIPNFRVFFEGTFVRARVINDPSPGLDTARDVHAV